MRQKLLIPSFIVGALLSAAPVRAAAITLETVQGSSPDELIARVLIADAQDLFSYQFDFTYDPIVVSAFGSADGTTLGQDEASVFFIPGLLPGELEPPDPSTGQPGVPPPGTVLMIGASIFPEQPGVNVAANQFSLLAQVFFRVVAPGDAGFALENVILLDSAGAAIDVAPPPAPVPEPSTFALLGVGLAALVRKRLRRKSERPA